MAEQLNFQIPSNVKPIYADDVHVNSGIKINQDKNKSGKEKITKIAQINLIFTDNFTKTAIARIVIDHATAKGLGRILLENAEKITKELDKKEIPKQIKEQLKKKKGLIQNTAIDSKIGYIG